MKKRLSIALLIILILCMGIPASARTPRNGRYIDRTGHIYIMRNGKPRTGWFKYHGKTYYGHKTSSPSYPKGSVTTDAFRIRNNKIYYFKHNGQKMTHSSKYIELRRGGTSVKYIYYGDTGARWRYNAKVHRYQVWNPGTGRYEDIGMQVWPDGSIDAQP